MTLAAKTHASNKRRLTNYVRRSALLLTESHSHNATFTGRAVGATDRISLFVKLRIMLAVSVVNVVTACGVVTYDRWSGPAPVVPAPSAKLALVDHLPKHEPKLVTVAAKD